MKNILVLSVIITLKLCVLSFSVSSAVSDTHSYFQLADHNSTALDLELDNSFLSYNNTIERLYRKSCSIAVYIDAFRFASVSNAYNVRAPPILLT